MAKDYAKFVPPKPNSSKKKKKSGNKDNFFILFFVLFLCGVVAVLILQKNPGGIFQKDLLAALHHKHAAPQIAQKAAAAKTEVAENKQAPVQFDFYNELPNMQVTVPAESTDTAAAPRPVKVVAAASQTENSISNTPDDTIPAGFPKMKELARIPGASSSSSAPTRAVVPAAADDTEELAAASAPASPHSAPSLSPEDTSATSEDTSADPVEAAAAEPAAAPKPAHAAAEAPQNIFSANEIDNMIAAENPQQYIVQVGSFDSDKAAQRLLAALKDVGFSARVVKQPEGAHTVYRVQQGPFESRELAKAGQQQLLKRGVTSFIRKTT